MGRFQIGWGFKMRPSTVSECAFHNVRTVKSVVMIAKHVGATITPQHERVALW